ncbi:MFS transporter [Kineococcus indalonis]|uniref:MFS transporter n=1 Tax=Kineococcus indalonis TaxID=2696566 RepID=UPI00196A68CA|nr:MFS transporter [Kineococcus indalonis]
MRRLLIPSAALLWGLQIAFLNPALALLLVALYGASAGQVGVVLAVYNAGGLIASLLVPAHADRRGEYLRPLLGCSVLTIALSAALALATSLPLAVVALVVLGGPAGVGTTLLFAHLKHSGAGTADVVNTRAIVSFAWVAGPPLATAVLGALGERALLGAIALVALLGAGTTAAMLRQRARGVQQATGAAGDAPTVAQPGSEQHAPMPRSRIALLLAVFVALQATNSAVVAVMGLFVTRSLGLDVAWAGIVLGVAAGIEIPALLMVGRLSTRVSESRLLFSGCVAGVVYYAAMSVATGPVVVLVLQVLNAWFFAVIAGVGLTLFQRVIARPGLASGLYANTRRVGAIASGGLVAVGATSWGYGGVFMACAALTLVALAGLSLMSRVGAEALD